MLFLAVAPTAPTVMMVPVPAPIAMMPIAIVPVITAPVMMPPMTVVVVSHSYINAGRLSRSRGDGTPRHQRRGQRKTCENLLHIALPNLPTHIKINAV
jgi:hypothetical protein